MKKRPVTVTEKTQEATGPRFATGKQMYESRVRSGPPLDITLRDYPESTSHVSR